MYLAIFHCREDRTIPVISKAKIRISFRTEDIFVKNGAEYIQSMCFAVVDTLDVRLRDSVNIATDFASRGSFCLGVQNEVPAIRSLSPSLERWDGPNTYPCITPHSQMICGGLPGITDCNNREHFATGNDILNTLRWRLSVGVGTELMLFRVFGNSGLRGSGISGPIGGGYRVFSGFGGTICGIDGSS